MSDKNAPVTTGNAPGADDAEQPEQMSNEKHRDGKVVVLRDFCTRVKGSDCGRCEIACPKGAISYTEEGLPFIDSDACTQCGICFGICDAFSSTRVTMLDLHERVRRIALRGETVYFTCKENIFPELHPAANVIVLPCLACLSPEFWTVVLSENIKVKVACDLSYCADCERAGEVAEMLYSHAISTAEGWTKKKIGFSDFIPEKEELLKDLTNPDGVDRRSAFNNLVGDVGDIASGKRRLRNSEVLQQFIERRERSKALAQLNFADEDLLNDFAAQGRVTKIMTPKRQMLLEAILSDPDIAKNVPLFLARIDKDLCTNTLECAAVCPTGALFPDPDDGKIDLDDRYCIGCGICVDVCPHNAIELEETTAERFIVENDELEG